MPTPITVPRLGWSMEEATLSAWHKSSGDAVQAGEALFALEGDKATQDIEALDAGVLHLPPDAPKTGDLVKVGQVIGLLLATGESPPASLFAPAPSAPRSVTPPAAAAAGSAPAADATPHLVEPPQSGASPRISPRARRVAGELGVDWSRLTGSGSTGRIREVDIRAAAGSAPAPSGPPRSAGLSGIRKTIADRMVASLRESAPVTLHTRVDATAMVAWRNRLKAGSAPDAPAPTYTDLLIHLTGRALAAHPHVNARWENGALQTPPGIHIGLAVDTDAGLLVPVVRNVPALDLPALASCTRDLAQRASARRLLPEELRGGTFTVTNLGTFGIDEFTPIINPPECAILGIGRILRRPWVVGDAIVPREILTLSLTFDHRVLDGAPAARFLQSIARGIEDADGATT